MRNLAAVLCLAIFLPSCLTEQIWSWASDSYAGSPEPVAAGENAEGELIILVATDGKSSPSFSVKLPSDWRDKISLSVDSSEKSIHAPIALRAGSLPKGGQSSLTPSEQPWYLRHDFDNGSIDILTMEDEAYLVVGTAQLPSERHWGRISVAALMSPITLTIDTITFLTAAIFFSWLDSPIDADGNSDETYEHSSETESSKKKPDGFIYPAKAPSGD